MAISKFDNGHYRPTKVWVPYDGHDYLVRFEDAEAETVLSVKLLYHIHYDDLRLPRATYRNLNINGPRAKAVIEVAQRIRAGELIA